MTRYGSSPQVRGPLPGATGAFGTHRLIPAGAGTTPARIMSDATFAAHPRRCGDHQLLTAEDINKYGSSPQVRGPPVVDNLTANKAGLIPAGAGTTQALARFM